MAVSSEFLGPGPKIEFLGPGAFGLAMHLPIGLRDGSWRQACPLGALADAAVDHDMGDMDALWPQLARHALGQRSQAELAHGKSRALAAAAQRRRGPGPQHRAAAGSQHHPPLAT